MIYFDVFQVEKQTGTVLFPLRTSYHIQPYLQRYHDNRPLITQSFKVVSAPVAMLFSENWVTSLTIEERTICISFDANFREHCGILMSDE